MGTVDIEFAKQALNDASAKIRVAIARVDAANEWMSQHVPLSAPRELLSAADLVSSLEKLLGDAENLICDAQHGLGDDE